MKAHHVLAAALLLTTAGAVPALASVAYVPTTVNLRAGPGTHYPVVSRIQNDRFIEVNGCLRDYSWCDVSVSENRRRNRWVEHGWVSGRYLQTAHRQRNNRYVVRPEAPLEAPVVGFNINQYWDEHYRGTDFYRDRDRYAWDNSRRGGDRRDRGNNWWGNRGNPWND